MRRFQCPICGGRDRVQRTIEGKRTRVCARCGPPRKQGQRDDIDDQDDENYLAVQIAIDEALGRPW